MSQVEGSGTAEMNRMLSISAEFWLEKIRIPPISGSPLLRVKVISRLVFGSTWLPLGPPRKAEPEKLWMTLPVLLSSWKLLYVSIEPR